MLPRDVWVLIFSFLPQPERLHLRRVCKDFNAYSRSTLLWDRDAPPAFKGYTERWTILKTLPPYTPTLHSMEFTYNDTFWFYSFDKQRLNLFGASYGMEVTFPKGFIYAAFGVVPDNPTGHVLPDALLRVTHGWRQDKSGSVFIIATSRQTARVRLFVRLDEINAFFYTDTDPDSKPHSRESFKFNLRKKFPTPTRFAICLPRYADTDWVSVDSITAIAPRSSFGGISRPP